MKITIASGKGGTGKTLIATNLSYIINQELNQEVTYLDCDVEEPNGHLFLPLDSKEEEKVKINSPLEIHLDRCEGCGKCSEVCTYNAIAVINGKGLLFPELCHVCGACSIVCPQDAIIERERVIGSLINGNSKEIKVHYGLLKHGEGGMTPTIIKEVKKHASENLNILDAPPGTSCSAVESVSGSDVCALITDLTPFGLHDLKLSVEMCRVIGIEPVVIINRSKFKDPGVRKYCREAGVDIIGEIPDDRQVAELYSRGQLVAKELNQYKEVFKDLAEKLMDLATKKPPAKSPVGDSLKPKYKSNENENENVIDNDNVDVVHDSNESLLREQKDPARQGNEDDTSKEIVVISGKGGTGKTSIVAAFSALAGESVVADCDVDAPDLHLILEPKDLERGLFSGGYMAKIDPDKCTGCGKCFENCRFESIIKEDRDESVNYAVDEFNCEGCGVCKLVCEDGAVQLEEAINGEWYISAMKYGYMAHANLGIAEENSGRLVTLTRQNASKLSSNKFEENKVYIDGSPGTGCPVIASLTGAGYALVVTEPTVSGVHDLERILELCSFFGIQAGVIVNKWDINPEKTETIKKRVYELGLDYLGSLPYDENVIKAQIEGKSIIEYDPSSEISKRIKDFYDGIIKNN